MKKILVIAFLFLAVVLGIFAADATISLSPFYAISGIPIGSSLYNYDGTGGWSGTSGQSSTYTNSEMIGLFSVYGVSGGLTKSLTVSVSAPNGLYLESQSQPAYKRPIEVFLVPGYNFNQHLDSVKLSESQSYYTFDISKAKSATSIWFDVILVLPGTLDPDSDEITYNEKKYKLIEAEDYSCLATFTVTYGDTSESLTIPFSGYYSKSSNAIKSSSVSMNVVMNANAYNLNLKTDQGSWIDIGEVSVMTSGDKINDSKNTAAKVAVFFSSSSDPFTKGEKFKMVKDNLGATTAKTTQNSLGFTLKVSKPSYNTSNGDPDYSKVGSGDWLTFDGTAYMDSDLQGYTVTSTYKQLFASKGFIIPTYQVRYYSDSAQHGTTSFYQYTSRIEMQLDTSDVTMSAGRYTGDIYIHVMILE